MKKTKKTMLPSAADLSRRDFISSTAKGVVGATLAFSLYGFVGPPAALAKSGSRFPGLSLASSDRGVIASISRQAALVGIDVLNRGGNAIDAAVATLFAICVVRPDQAGIGGAAHALLRLADGRVAALDGREKSPLGFSVDAFNPPGMHQKGVTPFGGYAGHRTVGVPGVVAVAAALVERFGSGNFSLAQLIEPAEKLAREGFEVTWELNVSAFIYKERLNYYEETRNVYGNLDKTYADAEMAKRTGQPIPKYKLPGLANSLGLIRNYGSSAFYEDRISESVARRIVEDSMAAEAAAGTNPVLLNDKGFFTLADLSTYEAKWRNPLIGHYRGHKIITMPPPSGGGVAVMQMLNILEEFPLGSGEFPVEDTWNSWVQSSTNHLHYLAEAQKLAFVDRRAYIADPDVYPDVENDAKRLASKRYGRERAALIQKCCAREYRDATSGLHTNHLSVIDQAGNAIALTSSMGGFFGSGITPVGTGFLLNNEIADWIQRPSSEDSNDFLDQPRGGARPMTHATPTIVVRDGVPMMVLGGTGGPFIPTGVVQAIVNMIDFPPRDDEPVSFGMRLARAIDAERIDAVAGDDEDTMETELGIEAERVEQVVLDALGKRGLLDDPAADRRGHTLSDRGEYSGLPWIEAAGVDPVTLKRWAVMDPRHDRTNAFTSSPGTDEEQGAAGQ